jgi:hypothetical protein
VRALYLAGQVSLVANKNVDATKLFSQAGEKSATKDPKMAVHMYGLAADASFRSGDKHRSQFNAAAGLSIWSRLPEKNRTGAALEGVRLLALVQFGLLDEKIATVHGKQISDGEKIVEQFGKIKSDAQAVEHKYAEIVKIGNAEAGVASLYRIAEIREFLANVLLKAPVPEGASAAEVDEFRSQVEKIALPMAEEATKLYLAAWQKSNESEAITPFQQKLHDKLAVLMPNDFRVVKAELPKPAYYSGDIPILPETKDIAKD